MQIPFMILITFAMVCRGKTVLVVNVASKWGLTAVNYTQLVQLHGKYSPGLAILAFPCNQFGNQEPGTAQEIKEFAAKFGVQFDMFAKVGGFFCNAVYYKKFYSRK